MSETLEKYNLHIITSLGLGGAETSLYNSLAGSSSENIVVNLSAPGKYSDPLRALGLTVYDLSLKRTSWRGLFAARNLLRKLTRNHDTDVFCWMYHPALLFFLAFPFSRKCTWLIRHGQYFDDRSLKKLIVSLLLIPISRVACKDIIYNSWFSRKSHERFLFPKSIGRVVLNFTPADRCRFSVDDRVRLRRMLGLTDAQTVYGCLARFHRDKGQDRLLKSWQRRPADTKNILLLQGYGCPEGVLGFFGGEGNTPQNVLVFDNRFSPSEFYSMIDAYVLPSRTESYPNSLAEAYLSGCFCVTVGVGDALAIVDHDAVALSNEDVAIQLDLVVSNGESVWPITPTERSARVAKRKKEGSLRDHLVALGIDK
jgi:glycosyltransferase involved in cell wall biosynthesis